MPSQTARPPHENIDRSRRPTIDEIREFWDDRVDSYATRPQATLGEMPMRRTEIARLMRHLRSGERVLDAGCGNGYSTLKFAEVYDSHFVGLDFVPSMIAAAQINHAAAAAEVRQRTTFLTGDVLQLPFPDGAFDTVVTERCLQNLPTWELQEKGMHELLRVVRPGGRFLMLECSRDGVRRLDTLRALVGKPPLGEVAEPWHNTFFEDRAVQQFAQALPSVASLRLETMGSTYLALTRTFGRFWRIATKLPDIGPFSYFRLYIFQKAP